MPTQRDEHMPDADFLALLASSVIQPRLASFEQDGCPRLIASYVVGVQNLLTDVGAVSSNGDADTHCNGELRVRVRHTGDPSRIVWRIESLFPHVMPSTGFVGFDAGGDARLGPDGWSIRNANWTGKYGVDYWHGWS
ncbi:hypothetical protein [Novipirellula rosea]|uniref:Uncharacterized protein n=1 Tax=Novipirellula rosea TaxID=1031540 RepID=A0ABP8NBC5_9BACT